MADIDPTVGDVIVFVGWGTKKGQKRVKADAGGVWPSEIKVRIRGKRTMPAEEVVRIMQPPVRQREVFELRQQLWRTADGRYFYRPVWVRTIVYESSAPLYLPESVESCSCVAPAF